MTLLALLPLAFLSFDQSRRVLDHAGQSERLAAVGETVQAAMPEVLAIQGAKTVAEVLAALVPAVSDDRAACTNLLARSVATQPLLGITSYIPVSGLVTCTTAEQSEVDLRGHPEFERHRGLREPAIIVLNSAPVTGNSILAVTHPVFDAEGRDLLGYIAVSVPQRILKTAPLPDGTTRARSLGLGSPLALMTFDSSGTVLSASNGLDNIAPLMPAHSEIGAVLARGEHSFIAEAADGEAHLYTLVPIAGTLYLLGVWPGDHIGKGVSALAEPFVFPLLMWLAGLAVAIIGSERYVTRHVRRLSRAMQNYALGAREQPDLALQDPPAEIASLAETYRSLTATILRDETELQSLIRQKESLLREVHHRTGNSLQLIASILRMHRRETRDEGLLQLLDHLHDRVMSLSTVHLGLYRLSGRSDVAINILMAEVIAKVSSIHWRVGRRDRIEFDLEPMVLASEQAVPLALLLAEVLSIFPMAGVQDTDAPIQIRMDTIWTSAEALLPATARLVISGPVAAGSILLGEHDGAPAIIAARLIRSFVAQLDGTLSIERSGEMVTASILFPIHGDGAKDDPIPPPPLI